jgi:hypothetical protein
LEIGLRKLRSARKTRICNPRKDIRNARKSQGLNPGELQSLGEGEHCDGGGLYLRVTGMGGRSWIVKYQWAKKQEKMGIGSLADVGLAAAPTVHHPAGGPRRYAGVGMTS